MLLLMKCNKHVPHIIFVRLVVHSSFSRCREFVLYNLVGYMSNKGFTLSLIFFSAADQISSHVYVEDANMELQQLDNNGYYFYNLV